MDRILQQFRAEPFWFAFKAVGAAVGLICLQQTGFISSNLVVYKGSFHPYTPPTSPPVPTSMVVKIAVDPLEPHPDYSDLHSIYSFLNDTSSIVAYQQANVSGTIVNMLVTANSSTHCFPMNSAATKGASTAFLPSRMMTWLISTGNDVLRFMLRRLADLVFFHNISMSTVYMVNIAIPLTVIAAFVGYHGYLGVHHVSEIYRANAKLAEIARDTEAQIVKLDEAFLLYIDEVAMLEQRAMRAEEAREKLQQQYAEASLLKDASDKEANIAWEEANSAKTALEEAAKALATARKETDNAKEEIETARNKAAADAGEADNKTTELSDRANKQRDTITSLRRDNSALQTDLQQARTEATTAAKTSKSSISQKDAEKLRAQVRDKDELLKSQGNNTANLQKKLGLLKERIRNSSPEALETLQDLMENEHRLHIAAVDKCTNLEAEITRTREAEVDARMQIAETIRSLEAAEHNAAQLEAEKIQQADAETRIKENLTTQADKAVKSQKVAEDTARRLQAELAQQAETEAEALRTLTIQVEEGVEFRNAAEEKIAVLEAEMAKVNDLSKTQVEEAVDIQKTTQAKHASLEAEKAQEAEAGADATRQLEQKLDASNRLLAELKGEMEEMDTDFHKSVDRFEDVQAAKDESIKALKTQIRNLKSPSPWSDEEASTSPQGMEEPPERPAVRLPATRSASTTTNGEDMDGRDLGFSIKGAAGKAKSISSSTDSQDSEAQDVVEKGHKNLAQRSSPAAKICLCDNCGRKHSPPCKYTDSTSTQNNISNPPATPSVGPPIQRGEQPPAQLPATTPTSAIDTSRIQGPQQGVYGAHRYTAPGLAPIRPNPSGFVPLPAAHRPGPSSRRGRGRGGQGQDGRLSVAESFRRQMRGLGRS